MNKINLSVRTWLFILITGMVCVPSKTIAADGQVAFSATFAVFSSSFNDNHGSRIRLNLAKFDEKQQLRIASSIDLPGYQSYSHLLIWKQYVFVLGGEPEIYIYVVDQNSIRHFKTLSIRGLESVPYYDNRGNVDGDMAMLINKNRLCLYGTRNDSFIDFATSPNDWKIESSPQKLPRESDIGWTWKHRGYAWMPKWGDCVPGKEYSFCLMTGNTSNTSESCCQKDRSPGQSHYTDLIITKRNGEIIDSFIIVGTKIETFD